MTGAQLKAIMLYQLEASNDTGTIVDVWAIPISVGMESNRKFDIVNALAEAGWVPWYQNIRALGPLHRVSGVLRLTVAEGRHVDLTWERGSGAPNFNRGEQFSANITLGF